MVTVVGAVPAVRQKIPAAAERDPVVDDQDLLVKACPRRGFGETEVDTGAVEPALRPMGIERARQRDRQSHVPDDDTYVQVRSLVAQSDQQTAERIVALLAQRRARRLQDRAGIEAPAEQQNRMLRRLDRPPGSREVGLIVHEDRGVVRVLDAPAGLARYE